MRYSNGGAYGHNKSSQSYTRQTIRVLLDLHFIFCYDVCRNVNQQVSLITGREMATQVQGSNR